MDVMESPSVPESGSRRPTTARRREEILRVALETFGQRGYAGGSLTEIASQVEMTHAGVLHHFGSKRGLLRDALSQRRAQDADHFRAADSPAGEALFHHLTETGRDNAQHPDLVRAHTVLSAEAVIEGHPAREHFRERYRALRATVRAAFCTYQGSEYVSEEELDAASAAILAAMDGLQVQWLLDPEEVDLARATEYAIDAIVEATIARASARSVP